MATSYPAGIDNFTEPSSPETVSLSEAGSGTRNHVQHHHDLGEAIEALQPNAALKTHDHNGVDDRFHGQKLAQANTHQSVDTDTATTAIHHTIGPGPNQAAPGNHFHDYSSPTGGIVGQPFILCTSTTRPSSPHVGLMIYETDTNRMRIWATFTAAPLHWQLLPVANIPSLRLRQAKRQQVFPTGTSVEWTEQIEDDFDYWVAGNPSVVTVKESGLYKITTATQWDPDWVPDVANIVLCINGAETDIRTQQFLRGNGFTPGFSQTLEVSGQLRFNANDALTIKVKHTATPGLLGKIFLFFDQTSKIKSRLDLQFVRP